MNKESVIICASYAAIALIYFAIAIAHVLGI